MMLATWKSRKDSGERVRSLDEQCQINLETLT